jgi:pyrroline-5-carboxylate reductase
MIIYGCGKMAGAMLQRWLATGLDPASVTAIRASGAAVADGVAVHTDADGLGPPSVLLIGIKPQQLADHVAALAALAGPGTLVLSILAGVPLADLTDLLPDAGAIVRVMPNMPVADGRGVVVTFGDAGARKAECDALLTPLGLVRGIADESGFDAVTALTGCGPAFVYRFVASLADAAVGLGLDPADADAMARAMVAGAAATLADSADDAATLADRVASPGGMTRAGLDVLDADAALAGLLADTLRAARDRGAALAAAARGS